jgi:hypothetical protein
VPPKERDPNPVDPQPEQTEEFIREQIIILQSHPAPENRAAAARLLGGLPAHTSIVIEPLHGALRGDASPAVIVAIIRALADLAPAAKPTIATLVKIVDETRNDEHRRLAFEALLSIDRRSPQVRNILERALWGGTIDKLRKPAASNLTSLILQNRAFACDIVARLGAEAKWAIPLLCPVLTLTIQEDIREQFPHNSKLIEKILTAMLAVDPIDPRSYNCLRENRDLLRGHPDRRERFADALVQIDSAIREMELARQAASKK